MVRLPDLRSGLISLVKILSIKELVTGLILVGIVIEGRISFVIMVSRKSKVGE